MLLNVGFVCAGDGCHLNLPDTIALGACDFHLFIGRFKRFDKIINTDRIIYIGEVLRNPEFYKTGAFVVSLQGNATTRNAFLEYIQSLENADGVAVVRSPVDNLLRETDVLFSIDVVLNKEFYSYVANP